MNFLTSFIYMDFVTGKERKETKIKRLKISLKSILRIKYMKRKYKVQDKEKPGKVQGTRQRETWKNG